jgi:membrane dipeptidase
MMEFCVIRPLPPGLRICVLIALTAQLGMTFAAETPSTEAHTLHERLLVLDTHLDTPSFFARPEWKITERHSIADEGSQVDLPRMIEGGLDGGFWAIFTGQGPRTPEGLQNARDAALLTAMRIREMVARHPQQFEIALSAADAPRIAGQGKRVVYLSIENGYPLGKDASLLRTFHKLGVRLFGPVHFRNNDLGDSATDSAREWNGLSPLGKELVTEANRLGIVLDASHASDDVLDQMLELSKTPILLSHSGSKAVFDHPRNVDDARLRRLAAKGGVIQMNSLGGYLIPIPAIPERDAALAVLAKKYGPANAVARDKVDEFRAARREIDQRYPLERATFEDFMKHMLHALKVVGPDHVGIGADWDGGGGVEGMEDVAALPRITERLLKEGYSPKDLEKIWGGNVLRVLGAAEQYAAHASR